MTTVQKRVTYAGQPVKNAPESFTDSLKMNLQTSTARQIMDARAQVADALEANAVPDHLLQPAIAFQSESKTALRSKIEADTMKAAKAAPAAQARSASYVREVGDSPAKAARRFSIAKAITNVIDGRTHEGIEAEMIAEGRSQFAGATGQIVVPDWAAREMRNVLGTNASVSGIDTQISGLQALAIGGEIAKHGQPLAEQLGAKVIDGMGGQTILLPWLGKTDAATADEGAAVTSSGDPQQVSLTPTRYARALTLSEISLRTTGGQIDQVIMADMSAALIAAQDKQAFAAIKSSAGWAKGTVHDTNGLAATDMEDLHNLVSGYMDATGLNAYPNLIVSRLGAKALNTGLSGSDTTLSERYVGQTGARIIPAVNLTDGDITSANAVGGTGTIAGAGLAFAGDMSSVVICRWGGFDLRVDFYGDNAAKNNVTMYANAYSAAGLLNEAFKQLAVTNANISAS